MNKARNYSLPEWAMGSNIYEVNIRQYTPEGNFKAFQKHLPRLKNMGIEIIWLMPITPISFYKRIEDLGSYYACSSYVNINPEYGSFSDFENLVKECHNLGLKIIIDWVANHTGCDHEWINLNPEWYLKDQKGNFVELNGWTDVIDLDYSDKKLRIEMINSMEFWVKNYKIDGFRCDMCHLVPLEFWQEARAKLNHYNLLWLGECENDNYFEVFNITYAWHWMHETYTREKNNLDLNNLLHILYQYSLVPNNGLKLFFTTNHDENSWNGTEFEKYGVNALNWAVFSIFWQGIPLIYSGQELPNHKRLKFFTKDEIHWTLKLDYEKFYTELLHFRKKSSAIKFGSIKLLDFNYNGWVLGFIRQYYTEQVIVLINFSNQNQEIIINENGLNSSFRDIKTNKKIQMANYLQIRIAPNDYLIYSSS